MELVLSELCVGSRLSGRDTKFTLVFHTEGLINNRIFELLKDFGRETRATFRPLLTCITPLCPMYYKDPWPGPSRAEVPRFNLNGAVISDYASKINELASYYDIGYHGHFFERSFNGYTTSFQKEAVLDQFDKEHAFLTDIGFRPSSYAGGTWFISPWLISKLESNGYRVDTTLNDVRKQTFLGPQPYANTTPGEPFWIGDRLLEVPSIRSFGTIVREFIITGRQRQNFAALAMHDYNLLDGGTAAMLRRIMLRMVHEERVLSVNELVKESTKWLASSHRAS